MWLHPLLITKIISWFVELFLGQGIYIGRVQFASTLLTPSSVVLLPCIMQRPTLQNVRIRSTRDALQLFNGVATNRLPLITRRLDAEERRAIIPGNVYVWSVALLIRRS
jgi:hypothetical protein